MPRFMLCPQPLAHTFQGQEGTTVPRVCRNAKGEELEFGNKTIKYFCQRFLSSSFFFSFQIISIILFDYADYGWFVGSKVEALLLNKNSPLVPSPCVWARLWKHWHKPQMKPESQQSQQLFEEPFWSQDIILLFENLKINVCRVCSTWSQGSHGFLQAQVLGQVDLVFHVNFSINHLCIPFHISSFSIFSKLSSKNSSFSNRIPNPHVISIPVVLLVVTRSR